MSFIRRINIRKIILLLMLIVMIVTSVFTLKAISPARASGSQINNVFVIVMENQNWSQIKNSSSAPYINSLLTQGAHAEQYYNPQGISPSLPNYLWLEAGTNFGILADDDPSSHPENTSQHLTTLLNNASISWKAYEEGINGTSCPVQSTSGGYAPKHDPFVYFTDVTNNNQDPNYCTNHIRPYTELASDLAKNNAARYNFITPNLCDDMHDTCSNNDPIAYGDKWLSQNVPAILNSSAYKNNGALFITWDEPGSGYVPIGMIALSPLAKVGYQNSNIRYTHGSTLRTLEEIFGVTPPLGDAAHETDLSDLFMPSAFNTTNTTGTTTPVNTPQTNPNCIAPNGTTTGATASPGPTNTPTTTGAPASTTTTGSSANPGNDEGDDTVSPPNTTSSTTTSSSTASPGATSTSTPTQTPSPCYPPSSLPTATSTAMTDSSLSPAALPAGATASTMFVAYWGDDTQKWQDLENNHPPGAIAIASNAAPLDGNDTAFAAILNSAHAAGLKVIGYVATGSGNVASVESNIDGWYKYQIDGIFLDEATSLIHSDNNIPYYQTLHDYIKARTTGPRIVAINIGWIPNSSQSLNVADILNVYENDIQQFSSFSPPSWMLTQPSYRFSEIVENVPNDQQQIANNYVATSVKQYHIGYIFLQDQAQHYDHVPPYWDTYELAAINSYNSAH